MAEKNSVWSIFSGKKGFVASLLVLCLTGCGSKTQTLPPTPAAVENPADVVWYQEKNGLRYRIESAPDLNHDGSIPLGLTACVYQLADIAAFLAQASSASGIDSLLDCKLGTADIRSSHIYHLQPGTTLDTSEDRMEKARYLAVVAGYSHMRPDLCVAMLPFPLHEETEGIVFRNKVYSAGAMQALIRFGRESVTISGVERVR